MSPHLVGRSTELGAFAEVTRNLVAGTGALVCVVGEAGIGKTSLLAAAAADLRSSGVTVATAGADETDRRRHLGLLRSLVPGVGTGTQPDPVDRALGAVELMAGAGPAALLADDVHWADDVSLDALRAIGHRAATLGVLLAVTARPQPASTAVQRLVEMSEDTGRCLRPRPLSDAEMAELVRERCGAPPGPGLATVIRSTDGNPFLVVELVAGLVDDGSVTVEDLLADVSHDAPLPGGLSQRLATRALGSVASGELLLRAAAAVPGGASADELAALLEMSLADVLTVTLAAVDAGVLVDTGTCMTFRHDLLRRSVIDATPASIVRTLTRRAAEVLHDRRADPERITACWLACADPDDEADIGRLIDLGREYRRQHPTAAAELLERALEGVPPASPLSRELSMELGWALIDAGRLDDVDRLLVDRLSSERSTVAIQWLRGMADGLAGRTDELAARTAALDPATVAATYDSSDDDAVDAVTELALLRVSTARLDEAAALVEWVDAARSPASAFRRATLETVKSWLASTSGRFEDGADRARAALRAVEEDESRRSSAASPSLALATSLDQLGEAGAALAASRGRVAQLVTPRWGPPLLQFFAAVALYRHGEWDDALAEVDGGLRAAEESDMGMAIFWPYAIATLIAGARGDSAEAARKLGEARSVTAGTALGGEWIAYAAAVAAEAEGDLDSAADLVEVVVAGVDAAGAPALLLNGGPQMIAMCLQADRRRPAEQIGETLTMLRSRSRSPVSAACAEWSEGLLTAAARPVEQAATDLLALGRLPESARAHHDGAELAALEGDTESARRLAKVAFSIYEDLGAEQWRRELRAGLRAAGLDIRPRRSPRRAQSGWESLTASEETIVGHVGNGLTNTQIAERLFVSRRTVESHLGRVYTKLGLSSRAQLVAQVLERRRDGGG